MSSPGRFATPLDDVIAHYPKREPRADLAAVEALMRVRGIVPTEQRVVVAGTNGKTSTATFLARLFEAGGLRTGLTTSPHTDRWAERVRISGREVDEQRLYAKVRELDAVGAGLEGLRFFDLITLAAAEIFVEDDVDVAVFETGLGGRLDASRCLRAEVVVLTGVDLDHTELLGETREEILAEKIRVAPGGATLVTAELGDDLMPLVQAYAADHALQPIVVPTGAGRYLERNLELARAAASAAAARWRLPSSPAELAISNEVPGRLQRATVDGAEVVVDAAHNEEGWRAFLSTVPSGFVAAVSISADRPAEVLAEVLARHRPSSVVVTCAWTERSAAAADLGRVLEAHGIQVTVEPDPARAVELAVTEGRRLDRPVLVFGSTYFLPHALAALDALGARS
jgi:dihydrofolate synthase/folylpolyglutamate synthase